MLAPILAPVLALSPVSAVAQTALPPAPYADTQLEDPALEAKARDFMLTIRCVTCQSQSIADSNASMASDLRSEIRTRIKAGEEPEAIRRWLIERYGNWISYTPTADPVLWPLWAAPVVLLLVGGTLVGTRLKRRKRP
ncbi:cytochrome c-type biogenesis protein CcmH [Sphingobium sufflavum]|uniref:cytochrome c-type biogenesis protein n=1 Tax=Sphingobium sufflavum TaxID=1129547 RepID=UPI001F27CA80|nr:cytochrome c-type biogenesis protein [Sphingobium sufflavum]MCE7797401.1 cytochrome c-type biogenesis protein CcmH [Sphingobium sufflavum]